MRHRKSNVKLGRTASHRDAMLRNMATILIKHESINTTLAKAKALQPVIDKLVTLAKQGDLESRRKIFGTLYEKKVAEKLLEISPSRFANRSSGFTLVGKTGFRAGDAAPKCVITLISETDTKAPVGRGGGLKIRADRGRRVAASKASGEGGVTKLSRAERVARSQAHVQAQAEAISQTAVDAQSSASTSEVSEQTDQLDLTKSPSPSVEVAPRTDEPKADETKADDSKPESESSDSKSDSESSDSKSDVPEPGEEDK
jgi:large subunit ribosomal protein L17